MSGKRRILKMIDNPLPDQVMEDYDIAYISDQFNEHCFDKALEIAKEFDLLPEFHNDFADYFTELCKELDEGYSLINDKSLIDDWWDQELCNSMETTPYIEDLDFSSEIIESLKKYGKYEFTLTADNIIHELGYMPCDLIENLEEVSPEIEDDEVCPLAEKFEVEWL